VRNAHVVVKRDQLDDRLESPSYADRLESPSYADRLESPSYADRLESPSYADRLESPSYAGNDLSASVCGAVINDEYLVALRSVEPSSTTSISSGGRDCSRSDSMQPAMNCSAL